jgi:hypothetical protein
LTSRYQHSGNAVPTTLSGGITASTTSITITDSSGWPDGSVGKFWVTLARGTASEEKIRVLSRTGTTLTLSGVGERGMEGTAAASHSAGATVEHTISATEIDEYNLQLAALTALGGTPLTTTATQSVTGKTITLGGNTVTGTLAQLNTAITDADIASLATAQTLTNKTLTAPVVDQFGAASGLGAAWTTYAPTWTAASSVSLTVAAGRYMQIGKMVTVQFVMIASGSSAAGTAWQMSLPVAPRELYNTITPLGHTALTSNNASWYFGMLFRNSAGSIAPLVTGGGAMTGVVAAADQWVGTLQYEVA